MSIFFPIFVLQKLKAILTILNLFLKIRIQRSECMDRQVDQNIKKNKFLEWTWAVNKKERDLKNKEY